MPVFGSDEPLWYNVNKWGPLYLAVPNFGDDVQTLNGTIAYLVDALGRNLAGVMWHTDSDLRTPPSINTLQRVHRLIIRGRTILAARAIAPNTPNMEAIHATPAPEDFVIYPVPYFRVRNRWLKEWCGLILAALSEAMQHTENRKEQEISVAFAGLCGQYLQRVYVRLATELLMIPRADAEKPDFTISDAQWATYDPSKWFTSTEMIDTNRIPWGDEIPTEDDMEPITNGIAASQLVGLQRYPRAEPSPVQQQGSGATVAGGAAISTGSFAPPPGP